MRRNQIPLYPHVFPLLLVGLGCAGSVGGPLTSSGPRPVKEVVLEGLRSPWSIVFLSNDEALVSEKEGGLLRVDLATRTRTSIRGVPQDLVTDINKAMPGDNGGLFDVVVDPAFEKNRRIYLAYAAQKGEGRTTKVIRAVLEGDLLTDVETLLVAEPFSEGQYHHYGGGLAIGRDGCLYVTVGERLFNELDQPTLPIAQDVSDRRGKIYRLHTDGTIPDDNPSFGPNAVPGLYAIGIRAAQGLTVHPTTAEIWFTEHGTRQGDEINRLIAGANYGWPIKTTGGYRSSDYTPPEMPGETFTPPVWSWPQTVAPTGLVFYQGDEFPSWRGDLLVSGLSRGSLWRMNFEGGAIVTVEELFVDDRVRSRKVATSPDGTLYLLTDTLFEVQASGRLRFTGQPSGQLIRITNAAG